MALRLAPLIVKRLCNTIAILLERGKGVLLIEHSTEAAPSIATSITVMKTGKVQYVDWASDLISWPEFIEMAYFWGCAA
jgi:ABC-type branched-subunit amino acid transport system ATPase component